LISEGGAIECDDGYGHGLSGTGLVHVDKADIQVRVCRCVEEPPKFRTAGANRSRGKSTGRIERITDRDRVQRQYRRLLALTRRRAADFVNRVDALGECALRQGLERITGAPWGRDRSAFRSMRFDRWRPACSRLWRSVIDQVPAFVIKPSRESPPAAHHPGDP